MATPISQLSGTFTSYASGNLLVVVDVTDTSMAGSGTDKKITVSSLLSNYSVVTNPGSTSITTLGTVTTGVWQATAIAPSYLTSMAAAGASHRAGIVPDPGAATHSPYYVLGDDAAWHAQTSITNLGTISSGAWQGSVIAPSYLTAMVASGASHSAGIVPDPGASAGTTRFLREDATWTADQSSSTVLTSSSTTARTLATRFSNVFNVLDWGADPTGVNDSATAINNLIAYVAALGYYAGYTIYFPSGNYKLNSTLLFAAKQATGGIHPAGYPWYGINVIGEGYQTRLFNGTTLTEMVRFEDCKHATMRGFRLYANGTLGSNLLSSSGWTSTGWTGTFGTGFTNGASNTTALTNTLAAVIGNYYQISYTITNWTTGSLSITFGGQTIGAITLSNSYGVCATTTGTLSIAPDSAGAFDGTISGISIKQVTTPVTTACLHITALTSCEMFHVTDVDIECNQAATIGFGIGMDCTAGHDDVAQVRADHCMVSQAILAGYLIGYGTSGNVLDEHFYGCISQQCTYVGVWMRASGVRWYGGYVGYNQVVDFFAEKGAPDQVEINGVRGEISNQFYWYRDTGNTSPVRLSNNMPLDYIGYSWTYSVGGTYPVPGSFALSTLDGYMVNFAGGGAVQLENNNFQTYTRVPFEPRLNFTGNQAYVIATGNTLGKAVSTSAISTGTYKNQHTMGKTGLNTAGANFLNFPGPSLNQTTPSTYANDPLGFSCGYQANFQRPIAVGPFNQSPLAGYHQVGGSMRMQAVSDPPTGASVVQIGSTGSTTYYYMYVLRDQWGNRTNASASFSTSTSLSAASFTTSNYNQLHIPPSGGNFIDILRSTDNATWFNVCPQSNAAACFQMPDGQWSFNPWINNTTSATTFFYADQSTTQGVPYALPARNVTGDFEADGYVTGSKLVASSVFPNLLAAGQANPTIGGWIGNNATIANAASPTIGGSPTLSATSPSGTRNLAPSVGIAGNALYIPLMPLTTYTASAWVLAGTTGRTVQILLNVYDGTLTRTRQVFGSTQTDNSSTATQVSSTITLAANEVFVLFFVQINSVPAGELHYIGQCMLTQGTSTSYLSPGATLTGTVITPTTSTFGGAVTAPLAGPVVTKTGAYTATSADRVILCSAASAGWALNLPAANTLTSGYELFIKKTDNNANAITVTPNGTDKIDGASSYALSSLNRYLYLVCDGSANWDVGGSNSLTDLGTGTPSSTTYLRGDATWSTAVSSVTFTGDGTVLSSTPSSAVTTSGTVAASLLTQAANKVLSGPTSGGAVAPTFRSLVAGDIPSTLNPTTIAAGSDVAVAILKANSTQTHDLLTVETSTPAVKGGINSNYNLYGALAADVITGRLTLSSTDPLADASAATTIYYLPYQGRGCITLYNTTSSQYENWLLGSSGVSLTLVGLSASTLYDIFIYNNSGTLTLQATAWTSSGVGTSTRATAITNDGGYWYLSGSQNKRYLGTIYLDASVKANDSVTARTVWNMHNRESKSLSWSFTITSPNPFTISNGSNTTVGAPQVYGVISSNSGGTLMQLPFCVGIANYSTALVGIQCFMVAPTNGTAYMGVSTSSTAFSNGFTQGQIATATSNNLVGIMSIPLAIGFGYLYGLGAVCSSVTSQTVSFYSPAVMSGTISC